MVSVECAALGRGVRPKRGRGSAAGPAEEHARRFDLAGLPAARSTGTRARDGQSTRPASATSEEPAKAIPAPRPTASFQQPSEGACSGGHSSVAWTAAATTARKSCTISKGTPAPLPSSRLVPRFIPSSPPSQARTTAQTPASTPSGALRYEASSGLPSYSRTICRAGRATYVVPSVIGFLLGVASWTLSFRTHCHLVGNHSIEVPCVHASISCGNHCAPPLFRNKPTCLGSATARLRPYAPRRHGETGASCAAQCRPRSSLLRGLGRPPWPRFPRCGA